jgi:predicted regulator of amino acid metabolism with ACT domain
MYKMLERAFADSPGKRKVAEAMLRYGLRVDERGRILCSEIELSPAKMARALGVDRRVVIETGRMIAQDDELYSIFSQLLPTAFIGRVADKLGFESIEIRAEPHQKGIVASVSSIVAKRGIGIRQIVADDPDIYPEPKLTLILEKKLDGAGIDKLRKVKGVREIVIR